MVHVVKVVVTLVQVGTNVWVNPQQVACVRPSQLDGAQVVVCTTDHNCHSTDWSMEKVLKALSETKDNGGR